MSHNRLFSLHASQISRRRKFECIRYRSLDFASSLNFTRRVTWCFLPMTEESGLDLVWKISVRSIKIFHIKYMLPTFSYEHVNP